MLVERKALYNAGDVVTFKLNNGDEMIASFISMDEHCYVVSQPVMVCPAMPWRDHRTLSGPSMLHAVSTADRMRMSLARSQVQMHGHTSGDFQNQYSTFIYG
jgi:hypothetical protein